MMIQIRATDGRALRLSTHNGAVVVLVERRSHCPLPHHLAWTPAHLEDIQYMEVK